MTKIILGNANNLSVSDDNSNGDTIIVGNGIDDTVSANGSNYNTITLGNGAGDLVTANGSSYDMITLGNGAGDAVNAKYSSYDTITLGNGNDTVTVGANSNITAGNGNDLVTAGPGSTISLGNGNDTVTAGSGSTISPPPITTLLPTLTTLVSFNGTNGATPVAGLIADAAGDLFGMTLSRRRERRWHGVRAGEQRRRQLHADHASQLQRHTTGYTPACRSDHRRRRGPLRHDSVRRGERRRHGVRDRQQRRRQLRQHADHTGQLQRHQRGSPVWRSDRRRRRGPLRHDNCWTGRTAMARCSRLPRPAAATPARRPHWSASTAPMGPPRGRPDRRRRRRPVRHDRSGGANGDGTVFEIAKTGSGYASTPTTLVSFNGANGATRMPV